MSYLFIVTWIIWFLSEVFLNLFMRAKNEDTGRRDKNSMIWIWVIVSASVFMGVLAVIYLYLPISKYEIIRYAGLLVIIAGMIIRFIAITTLGKFFTVNLAVHNDHRIIRHGLYKFVRHPSYSGLLISFIGLGLSMNNWLSLLLVVSPILLIMLHRINIEEKMLVQQFGGEYETYQKKTWRLVPGIF
jgi:protein-S-isoprenylcysteine O-methyltransferase Ste14